MTVNSLEKFKLHYEDLEDDNKKLSYWIGDRLYDIAVTFRKWLQK